LFSATESATKSAKICHKHFHQYVDFIMMNILWSFS
jgi:hypothetical protein